MAHFLKRKHSNTITQVSSIKLMNIVQIVDGLVDQSLVRPTFFARTRGP